MSLKNGSNNLYFHSYTIDERQKPFSYLTSLFRRGPVNPSILTYRKNKKFNCFLEIQSKKAARISICTLDPLKLSSNQIHIWRQFLAVAR